MRDDSLRGVIPYLVSPFDPQGQLLEESLRQLVRDLLDAGVHGITPLGSTGEFAYLTFDQRLNLVQTVIDEVAGSVPVLPGVAAASTYDAVAQAQHMAKAGAAGLVLVMNTYFSPTQRSIANYFRDVAASVDVPIIIYTNPALQGYVIQPATLEAILEQPNVRYIKDASGNTARLLTMQREFGDRLGIFAASAHLPVTVLQLGGLGIMSGPACLVPGPLLSLFESFAAGDVRRALELQRDLSALSDLFLRFNLAACVKAGLQHLGYATGHPIPPQEPLEAKEKEEIARVLDRLDSIRAQRHAT